MNMKKIAVASVAGMMLGGVPLATGAQIASANEVAGQAVMSEQLEGSTFDSATPSAQQLQDFGFSAEEIDALLNSETTGIYLHNGVAYDKDGNPMPTTAGKLSWATKAIRKGYNKVPKNVKKIIEKYTQIEFILGVVEHMTGTVEDAIYKACKYAGMPDWAAWTVSKALTLAI